MSKLFLSLVLVFLLFVIASSDAANKVVDAGELCKQTRNPSFCLALLISSSGRKDLLSLVQYTINVVRAELTNTITLLKYLVAKSGSDPKAKAHYKDCLDIFDSEFGLVGDIDDTQDALNKRDYAGIGAHASALFDGINHCISGENPGEYFSDPSLLPTYGGIMVDVTDIIIVISNTLRGS